ncbi:S49 family peptidase [Limimonas halophila]|uniref:S49 family peptidase n=1 Tax=Limimonas halophila TaxID=1082479 RepID=UPI003F5883F2
MNRPNVETWPLIRRLPPVVSVVRLQGAIGAAGTLRGGMTLAGLAGPLYRAFKTPRVKAVALAINSPGGSPVQSALLAQRIRDLAREHDVPVYAFCEDAAASGGYWLACAADQIHAHPSSIVGSIGVVSAGFGFPELLRRHGVERRVYTSGEKKVILDPFEEEDPDDVARLKGIQADIHEQFKAMVRERRGGKLHADEADIFSGAFWTGQRAFELGLVDGLGEMRSTLRGIYGPRVRLREVPIQRKLFGRIPIGGRSTPAADTGGGTWTGDVLAGLEERALWGRYGL